MYDARKNAQVRLAINTQEDVEEERRVLHIAVTRAKDELYLVVPHLDVIFKQNLARAHIYCAIQFF